jgi:transcriptional regulator with XRE-family HTH domain
MHSKVIAREAQYCALIFQSTQIKSFYPIPKSSILERFEDILELIIFKVRISFLYLLNFTDLNMNLIPKHTENHQGKNLKRLRLLFGWKQEALAIQLGSEWSQKRVSLLEAKEKFDPAALALVAAALNIPENAIKNFDEQEALVYIHSLNDKSVRKELISDGDPNAFYLRYNYMEMLESCRKLYELLLESEREKIEILKSKLG